MLFTDGVTASVSGAWFYTARGKNSNSSSFGNSSYKCLPLEKYYILHKYAMTILFRLLIPYISLFALNEVSSIVTTKITLLHPFQCELSGYLLRKFKNSPGWQKLWAVFSNLCFYFSRSSTDSSHLASLPLLGYTITPVTLDEAEYLGRRAGQQQRLTGTQVETARTEVGQFGDEAVVAGQEAVESVREKEAIVSDTLASGIDVSRPGLWTKAKSTQKLVPAGSGQCSIAHELKPAGNRLATDLKATACSRQNVIRVAYKSHVYYFRSEGPITHAR
ncbi:unnamed protein product [Protopolystoma xenopodis]|uniref:PH domain-containing protein n=1 Tax=Protopolystoma xenopodis TaxID=117903 RepID=A0A448WMB6_9PLAT|nr:unnamed protein product [Protopolystoma xenopodis]